MMYVVTRIDTKPAGILPCECTLVAQEEGLQEIMKRDRKKSYMLSQSNLIIVQKTHNKRPR
jgi:hypothetical protein